MYDKGYVRLTALRRDAMPFFPTLRIGLNDLAPYLLMVNCQWSCRVHDSACNTHNHYPKGLQARYNR